jgi:aldose 1-epimerase
MNKNFYSRLEHHPDLGNVVFLAYHDPSKLRGPLEVGIAPEFGSNMFRFRADGLDLIYCETQALANHDYNGNFVLWPFPNRVRQRTWRWRGKTYSLENVATPQGDYSLIHGLVRDRTWGFEEPTVTNDRAIVKTFVEMKPGVPYFDCYPFPSRLTLTYTLTNNAVRIDFEVKNLGTEALPFGFALHPLFSTLPSGTNNTAITLLARSVMETESDLLPTGKLLSVMEHPKLFDLSLPRQISDLNLDHVYTSLSPDRNAIIDHRKQNLKINFSASHDFTHCVVYTGQKEKFICIEHQTCATDAINLYEQGFNDVAHLITLSPGESHHGYINYCIEDYRNK